MDNKRPVMRMVLLQSPVVRLERILIENIKGVEYGEVSTLNHRRPDGPRVLGLYGQNGSGKSTLMEVLKVVKRCLLGLPLDDGGKEAC